MWLSSTAQQAIQAVLCIAGSTDDGPVRVDEIASVIGCPRNYLSKTLHLLTRAGVLRSERGPKGGFRLASPPDRITLARVVAPFEPVGERRCLVGRPTCGDANPCAAHHRWKKVAGSVDDFFNKTTIGYEALVQFAKTWRSDRGGAFLQHWNNQLVITPSAGGARGSAYMMLVDRRTQPPSIRQVYEYDDELVKTNAGWRFKSRSFVQLPAPPK